MGDIHHLPNAGRSSARLLQRAVDEAIADHPDPAVATRWSAMARATIARWPGPPTPSRLELDVELDDVRRARLIASLESWMGSYFDDVRDQLMAMHGELLGLQRQVAEHEVERARTEPTSEEP